MNARLCAWCKGPIPEVRRPDAVCCSVRCRQAKHRFTASVGVSSLRAGVPLRLAYADPPYPGRAARYYASHPDYAGEVNHAALLQQLAGYDGWALSTAADCLPMVLALCPPGVRVAAWVRGERPNARAGRPLNAWEPVIDWGGRVRQPEPSSLTVVDASCMATVDASGVAGLDASRSAASDASRAAARRLDDSGKPVRRTDVLIHRPRPRSTAPGHVMGAKPAEFARWMFDLLGAQSGDELDDLFPGSGGIARAWEAFTQPDNQTEVRYG